MRIWRRAWLYTRRKTGKSMLLLLVMLFLFLLVMIGMLLHYTTDAAIRQTRQKIGGGFRIAPDMQNRDNVVVNTVGGHTSIAYVGEPINEEMIQAVLARPEINMYNAVLRGEALLPENLSLIDYNGQYGEDETISHLISVEANTNLLLSRHFQSKQVRLTDGQLTGISGENTAVISDALALKNNLHIGDEIQILPNETENGIPICVKIIGLFTVETSQQHKETLAPVYLLENKIFLSPDSGRALSGAAGADYVDFFVSDPALVYEMMENLPKINHIRWECFAVTARIEEYEKAAGPLQSIRELADFLLAIMSVVSIAVLSLIQALFHRSRQPEMGIMLSVGISKFEILFQHFIETAFLATAVFGIAICISFTAWPSIYRSIFGTDIYGSVDRLDAAEAAAVIAMTCVCGILGLFVSTVFSNLWLMRLSPRKILSSLS